jgi:hypothetical protein
MFRALAFLLSLCAGVKPNLFVHCIKISSLCNGPSKLGVRRAVVHTVFDLCPLPMLICCHVEEFVRHTVSCVSICRVTN